jgi:hypothetical protein
MLIYLRNAGTTRLVTFVEAGSRPASLSDLKQEKAVLVSKLNFNYQHLLNGLKYPNKKD